MDNAKHTPEPWLVSFDRDNVLIEAEDYIIARVNGYVQNEDLQDCEEANARRIVACVNACKGFDTETLEFLNDIEYILGQRTEELEKALMQSAKLREENERLRAALEKADWFISEHFEHCTTIIAGEVDIQKIIKASICNAAIK